MRERLENPIDSVMVGRGPVKENIVKGADVDLYKLPVPKWNKNRQGGATSTQRVQ